MQEGENKDFCMMEAAIRFRNAENNFIYHCLTLANHVLIQVNLNDVILHIC